MLNFLISLLLFAPPSLLLLYGDIRDLNHYSNDAKSQILLLDIEQNTSKYVPKQVHFLKNGPSQKKLNNQIYGVEHLNSIISITYTDEEILKYRKYEWTNYTKTETPEIKFLEENTYKNEEFFLEVNQVGRSMTLRSTNILTIYPLGVGSFDFITHKIDNPKSNEYIIKLMRSEERR